MADTLTLGDVVQLKSGGPHMTIIDRGAGGGWLTAWFSGDEPHTNVFPEVALERVPA